MTNPLISICIPTYERLDYLKRLLESIRIQTFRNFEVIITDDSKTDAVQSFLKEYTADFTLHYYKNPTSLGTAKNMVAGIRYAASEWIKIIHDDDWFTDANSLAIFATYAKEGNKIIYSGFIIFEETTTKKRNSTFNERAFKKILKNPYLLLANNIIGVPSVSMFRKDETILYDERFNWLTDIECYVRLFEAYGIQNVYIPQPLVTISYNSSQLTTLLSRDPHVVISDFLLFYLKHPDTELKNILVYDAWWRMVRNFKIKSTEDITHFTDYPIPLFLKNIIKMQKRIPFKLRSNKFVSKLSMAYSYFINNRKMN